LGVIKNVLNYAEASNNPSSQSKAKEFVKKKAIKLIMLKKIIIAQLEFDYWVDYLMFVCLAFFHKQSVQLLA
jgi:hypothetical protein